MRREDRERQRDTAQHAGEKDRPGDPRRAPAQEQGKAGHTPDQPQARPERPHGKLPIPD